MDERIIRRVCDNTLAKGLKMVMDEVEQVIGKEENRDLLNSIAIIAQIHAELQYRKRTGNVLKHEGCCDNKKKVARKLGKQDEELVIKALEKLFS